MCNLFNKKKDPDIIEFDRDERIQITRNFSTIEFQCKCGKCKKQYISRSHVEKLQELRDYFGQPVYPTSGYRCPAHNKAEGGKKKSQHPKGVATDITVLHVIPERVAEYAESRFNGLGRYKDFTHLDSRKGHKARW